MLLIGDPYTIRLSILSDSTQNCKWHVLSVYILFVVVYLFWSFLRTAMTRLYLLGNGNLHLSNQESVYGFHSHNVHFRIQYISLYNVQRKSKQSKRQVIYGQMKRCIIVKTHTNPSMSNQPIVKHHHIQCALLRGFHCMHMSVIHSHGSKSKQTQAQRQTYSLPPPPPLPHTSPLIPPRLALVQSILSLCSHFEPESLLCVFVAFMQYIFLYEHAHA